MASNKSLIFFLAILAVTLLPNLTMAAEYWVGDFSGWTIDFDYQAWAKNKVFQVGDTLVFNYTEGAHNVYRVDGVGFNTCTVPTSGGLSSGHDVITLATPGKKWYICGVGRHCADHAQKLVITVVGGTPSPAPSPASVPHRPIQRVSTFVKASSPVPSPAPVPHGPIPGISKFARTPSPAPVPQGPIPGVSTFVRASSPAPSLAPVPHGPIRGISMFAN